MIRTASCFALTALASGCQGYEPAPIDLAAHARDFAARLPEGDSVARFVAEFRRRVPDAPGYDPSDGVDLGEARLLALLFNPELRAARLQSGVALASRDHAGLWADPELRGDFARILEDVAHPWVLAGAIGITIPITGRPGLERDLADGKLRLSWTSALVAEGKVLAELELHHAEWSAAREQQALLEDLIERLRQIEAIAGRLVAADEVTRLEARVFTLERASREGDLLREKATVAEQELAVRQLIGVAPDAPLRLQPRLLLEPRQATREARAEAALRGPRLAMKRREYDVAERELALAVRKQWPELSVFPGWQEEDGQPRAALGFSLPLPLWNRNARQIAEAQATRTALGETLRGELEQTLQDLARAEVALASARARREQLERFQLPLVEEQVQEGRRLAELGRLDTLLLLDGLVRAFGAKARVVETALAEARAVARLNAFSWPLLSASEPVEDAR